MLTALTFQRVCREGGRSLADWLHAFDRQHARALYRDAAAVLHDWGQAEDAVQTALVRAWQRCASFQGQGEPLAWIRSIVRHAALDLLAQRRSDQSLDGGGDDDAPTAEVRRAVERASIERVASPDATLQQAECDRLFREGMARFAAAHPAHAAVLRWVAEDGLTPAELQHVLGRSPGATREFVSQCRKKARPFLADWLAALDRGTGAAR